MPVHEITVRKNKALGWWEFDDARVGLVAEPLVDGIDTILDVVTNGGTTAVVQFSDTAFPEASIRLHRMAPRDGGYWYYSTELHMEGWLCPNMLKYYAEHPETIYVHVKAAA